MTDRPRRCFAREVGNPLSMFHEKDSKGREKKWSQFRVTVFMFGLAYVVHVMPNPRWMSSAVVALGVAILFALPLRDVMRLVPGSEALLALRAFFENVMGRAAAAVTDRASGMMTHAASYFSGPAAPAGAPVPDGPGVLRIDDLTSPVTQGRPTDEDLP